ncbi:MAG: ATP-dependent DNA helicase RecQ [Bacteroidetes bacterium]|nr:ATP-dependent DNA helicase RecQ [Bacteroidota bacterium]
MNDPLTEHLREVYRLPSFRSLQRQVIDRLYSDRYVAAFLPTGMGKTLLYQVPTTFYRLKTVVISPLIALISDQLRRCSELNIPSWSMHGLQSADENKSALNCFLTSDWGVLFLSPERWISGVGEAVASQIPSLLLVLDEVHCMSTWGKSFRSSYLKLVYPFQRFPESRFLALSATPAPDLVDLIAAQFGLEKLEVLTGDLYRTNLSYQLREVPSKVQFLVQTLQARPGSSIIYTRSRRQTEQLGQVLNQAGVATACYHAGMPADLRRQSGNRFLSNETPVMVATSAFGMGVDKPDIRLIIHLDVPVLTEDYLQESGRGGRDGKTCWAAMFLEPADVADAEAGIHDLRKMIHEGGRWPPHPRSITARRIVADMIRRNPWSVPVAGKIQNRVLVQIPEEIFYLTFPDEKDNLLIDRMLHMVGGQLTRQPTGVDLERLSKDCQMTLQQALQCLGRLKPMGVMVCDDSHEALLTIPEGPGERQNFGEWATAFFRAELQRLLFWNLYLTGKGCRMAALVSHLTGTGKAFRCGLCDACRSGPSRSFTLNEFDQVAKCLKKQESILFSDLEATVGAMWIRSDVSEPVSGYHLRKIIDWSYRQGLLSIDRRGMDHEISWRTD